MTMGTPGHAFCTELYNVSILISHQSISSRVSGVEVDISLATERRPKYAKSHTEICMCTLAMLAF